MLRELEPLSAVHLPEFRKQQEDNAPLRMWDLIEFEWCDRDGSPLHQTMKIEVGDPGENPAPSSRIISSTSIVQAVRPRVTLAILGRVNRLKLTCPEAPSRIFDKDVVLSANGKFLLEPSLSPRPSHVRDIFKNLIANDGSRISVRFLRKPARYAFPGDVVSTTLLWFARTEGHQSFSMAHAEAAVQPDGELFVSGLSSPGVFTVPNDILLSSGLARQWVGEVDGAQMPIRCWIPGEPLAGQPSLQEIAATLTGLWALGDASDPAFPVSLQSEISQRFRQGIDATAHRDTVTDTLLTNNERVRYHFELNQEWCLRLPDGRMEKVAFLPGETIASAVSRELRRIFGRENERWKNHYVVVIPRPELGPGGTTPFWARYDDPRLFAVYLMPGDSVHITSLRPHLIHP